ncbi:probable ATP-dependent RNA helicase DDX49 [Onthophagus taurus]|uniref:probable ATP-dependent RNA helicase DDX49 n=1 Tax=Onthophagus taurus TaxID=166361 RepID=UPI0039BDBB65
MKSFENLNIDPWLLRQCTKIGVLNPTPVQENCIPKILSGQDCIGAAKTGSGKTLAFALPILQTLANDPFGIFALILTPVRELAFQICDQFNVLGKPLNLRCAVIVGGMDMVLQGQELSKRPHIVVATPGRLADHLESCNTFSLGKIKYLVLDEADRLLSGQFEEQMATIFRVLPKNRQNLFFSATITDSLKAFKEIAKTDVFLYETPEEVATVDELDQFYVLCPKDIRDGYFVETIRSYRTKDPDGSIMIFVDSCKKCQVLSMMLNDVGFENVSLHAMISQSQRLAALARFKSNTVKILIATDVAARGLDIPSVQLVINHTIPKIPKEYVHRVGRTARAGRKGVAITLMSQYDVELLHKVEDFINTKLKEYKVNDAEVGKIFTQIAVSKGEAHITLDEKDFFEKKMINKRKKWILGGLDPDEEERKYFKKDLKRRRKDNKKNKDDVVSVDKE